jgi:hypothetical protein
MWATLLKCIIETRITKCILTLERPTRSYGHTMHNNFEENEIFLER